MCVLGFGAHRKRNWVVRRAAWDDAMGWPRTLRR